MNVKNLGSYNILYCKNKKIGTPKTDTVELQWLEHLWDYENMFETGVVRAIEGLL